MPETENFDYNVFFEFEKKHSLFDLKNGNLFYWDIIRNDIYLELLWNYSSVEHQRTERSFKNFLSFVKIILKFLHFVFFKRCKYLFFTAARNKINDSQFYDQNLADILKIYSANSILLENFNSNNKSWYYQNSVFNPIFIFRKIGSYFVKSLDFSSLVQLLSNEFSEFNLNSEDLNAIYKRFRVDYFYYNLILKLKRPKIIFITQFGLQKGLFAAAKHNLIPVIEAQHGIIDEGHLQYNYNREIKYIADQYYLPDCFLSFSDFWTADIYMPVKQVSAVGNTAFAKKVQLTDSKNIALEKDGLLVVSSIIFGKNLLELIMNFATDDSKTRIYFKLHPEQFKEVHYYRDKLSNFKNIEVLTNEKSVLELLLKSKAILAIQSTAVYEALYSDKIAIIYKKQSYQRHSHVFDHHNVYLIDNEKELETAMNMKAVKGDFSHDLFFKTFDKNAFLSMMEKDYYE